MFPHDSLRPLVVGYSIIKGGVKQQNVMPGIAKDRGDRGKAHRRQNAGKRMDVSAPALVFIAPGLEQNYAHAPSFISPGK
jgi:hypothetical protein